MTYKFTVIDISTGDARHANRFALDISQDIADMLIATGLFDDGIECRIAITQGKVQVGGIRVTDPYARIAVYEETSEVMIMEISSA
jgi:hypothetical protein